MSALSAWLLWATVDNTQISVFSLNTEKDGPEITPYLDAFHAVQILILCFCFFNLDNQFGWEMSGFQYSGNEFTTFEKTSEMQFSYFLKWPNCQIFNAILPSRPPLGGLQCFSIPPSEFALSRAVVQRGLRRRQSAIFSSTGCIPLFRK